MSHPEIRFDAVLPSHLIFNENIKSSAKIFYAVIRNLCNQCGHCWASNSYLSELMKISDRQIRAWLEDLKEEGYIQIEYGDPSENTERKIFICNDFNKSIPRKKTSAPPEENFHHKEDNIKKIDNCTVIDPPAASDQIEEKKFLKKFGMRDQEVICSLDEVFKHSIRSRTDWGTNEILDAWHILDKYEGAVSDYIKFIAGTIKQFRLKQKSNFNRIKENKGCKTGIVALKKEEALSERCKGRSLDDAMKERLLQRSSAMNSQKEQT